MGREPSSGLRNSSSTITEEEKDQLLLSYTIKLLEAKAQLESLEKQEQTLQQTLRQHEVEFEKSMREAEYVRSSRSSHRESLRSIEQFPQQAQAQQQQHHYPNSHHIGSSVNINDNNMQLLNQEEADILQIIRTEIRHENSHLLSGIKQYISDFMRMQQNQQIELERMKNRTSQAELKELKSQQHYAPPTTSKQHQQQHNNHNNHNFLNHKNISRSSRDSNHSNDFLSPLSSIDSGKQHVNVNNYKIKNSPMTKHNNRLNQQNSQSNKKVVPLPSIHHERPLIADSKWVPMSHSVR